MSTHPSDPPLPEIPAEVSSGVARMMRDSGHSDEVRWSCSVLDGRVCVFADSSRPPGSPFGRGDIRVAFVGECAKPPKAGTSTGALGKAQVQALVEDYVEATSDRTHDGGRDLLVVHEHGVTSQSVTSLPEGTTVDAMSMDEITRPRVDSELQPRLRLLPRPPDGCSAKDLPGICRDDPVRRWFRMPMGSVLESVSGPVVAYRAFSG